MAWTQAGPGRPPGTPDSIQRLTIKARYLMVQYLMTGRSKDLATGEEIPQAWRARLDELVKASRAGDVKATRDIIDRVAGRATQNLDINVSDRKLIRDDTPKLEPGAPIAHIPPSEYTVREAESEDMA